MRRLLIVTGKGGVGRSALAAALALRTAREGHRVLAVAMTDGIGLAAHLRVGSLEYRPRSIRPGLSAMLIDPAEALEEYLRLQLRAPTLVPFGGAFRLLADTVPGIRDTVVMGKVLYEVRSGRWDVVVADGPPLGQAGSYLRAPATIRDLVPAGRVENQSAWMADLLKDPDTTELMLLTVPEELPVLETREALESLGQEQTVSRVTTVANRLLPPAGMDDAAVDALPPGAARDAVRLHRQLRISQQSWLNELPDGPRLPYLFGVLTPGEVSAQLADLWESP